MSTPPVAERRRAVLLAHADERVDDWYWLADKQDPAVLQLLEAENAYADESLASVHPLRDALYQEIVGRIVETDLSVPVRRGPWWYYQRTEQGHSYPVHCRRPATPGQATPVDQGEKAVMDEEILIDENKLAEGLDYLELANLAVSPDHRWLAYATDSDGSERYQLRFRRLQADPHADPEDTNPAISEASEIVPDTYYGLAWANDNATVFYTKVDDAMRPYQLWRHALGTDPTEDELVFTEPDQRFVLQVGRSKDASRIFIALSSTSTTETWVLPADHPEQPPTVIEPRRAGVEYGVDHHPGSADSEGWYLIMTNDEALDFRLMVAPGGAPGRPNWREVIGHRPGTRLEDVDVFDRWVAIGERLDGEARLRVAELTVPEDGSDPFGSDLLARSWLVESAERPATTWQGPNPEMDSTLLRYEQTSLVSPRAIYEMDVMARRPVLLKRQPLLGPYDASDYVTFRSWATATDGTKVPLSVVHRADLLADPAADGGTLRTPAPCLLYGYGAYEHSIDPGFSSLRLSLLDRGFVFAIAHVRGGGELGRSWYEDGKLEAKTNTFSDFIACARHLIDGGFTEPALLAARGGSAGGLLIGAVANEAPELFRALVAEVPFVDCLTTMQDDSLPLTVGEWEEWGNPVADPAVYALMKSYSPYDNVTARNADGSIRHYPDIYATAGLNDPRVGYWEPAKWVQKIREANAENRVLLRTELGAGHGGPSGRYEAWRDEALVFAFLLDALQQAGSTDA